MAIHRRSHLGGCSLYKVRLFEWRLGEGQETGNSIQRTQAKSSIRRFASKLRLRILCLSDQHYAKKRSFYYWRCSCCSPCSGNLLETCQCGQSYALLLPNGVASLNWLNQLSWEVLGWEVLLVFWYIMAGLPQEIPLQQLKLLQPLRSDP